jgi:malonyl-CoA O-methyltransferase
MAAEKRVEHVSAKEGYDRWAGVYDTDGNALVALDDDVVPGLLGDVKEKDVLELAGGTGRHTIRLADAGARLTAVDFSRGMLEVAKRRLEGRAVTFGEADLRARLPFDDASFDLVVCCLAVEHVENLDPVFREVRRVLRKGGAFVCSDMHPAMRLRGNYASFDDHDGTDVRVEGYEHPIVTYVSAALSAGFRLEKLEEHKGSEELVEKTARAARYVGWPMLFAMRGIAD